MRSTRWTSRRSVVTNPIQLSCSRERWLSETGCNTAIGRAPSVVPRASGVGAVIEAASVPLSNDARGLVASSATALATVLTGGNDYEILATVDRAKAAAFVDEAEAVGVPVTEIGRVVAAENGPAPVVLDRAGLPLHLAQIGHRHF